MVEKVFTIGRDDCDKSLQKIDELETAYTKLTSKFEPIFNLFDGVQSALDSITNGMRSADVASKALKGLMGKLPVTGPAKFLKEASRIALGVAGKVAKGIGNAAKRLSRQLQPLFKAVGEVRDFLHKPFNLFFSIRQIIIRVKTICIQLIPQEMLLIEAWPSYAAKLLAIWVQIRSIFDKVLKNLIAFINAIVSKIDKIIADLTKAVADLARMLPGLETLSSMMDSLNEQLESLDGVVGDVLDKVDDAVDAAKEAANELLDWFQSLPGVGDVVKAAREAASDLMDAFEALKAKLEKKVADAIKDMGALDAIQKPIDTMTNALSTFSEVVQREARQAVDTLLNGLKSIAGNFAESIQWLLRFVASKVGFEDIVERLKRQLNDMLGALRQILPADRLAKAEEAAAVVGEIAQVVRRNRSDDVDGYRWQSTFVRRARRLEGVLIYPLPSNDDLAWTSKVDRAHTLSARLWEEWDEFAPLRDPPEMEEGYFGRLAEVIETTDAELSEHFALIEDAENEPEFDWLPIAPRVFVGDYEPVLAIENEWGKGFDPELERGAGELREAYAKLEQAHMKVEQTIAEAA